MKTKNRDRVILCEKCGKVHIGYKCKTRRPLDRNTELVTNIHISYKIRKILRTYFKNIEPKNYVGIERDTDLAIATLKEIYDVLFREYEAKI